MASTLVVLAVAKLLVAARFLVVIRSRACAALSTSFEGRIGRKEVGVEAIRSGPSQEYYNTISGEFQ